MKYVWLLLLTIVITDPYSDIVYGEIDVYEYPEKKSRAETSRKRKYKSRKYREKKKVWCWICEPPRFLYRKD